MSRGKMGDEKYLQFIQKPCKGDKDKEIKLIVETVKDEDEVAGLFSFRF